MANTKKYIRGGAKEIHFNNGSSLINYSINIFDDTVKDAADENGWVQLVMTEKREVDKYGNTHSSYLNEFKPDASKAKAKPEVPAPADDDPDPNNIGEVMPF